MIKRLHITVDRLREILSYDRDSGEFTWIVAPRGHRKGPAGTKNAGGYIQIKVDGRLYYAHRLAWAYVHGEIPAVEIDHKNGNRADNREVNLRDASRTFNSENVKSAHRDSSTGFLGVSFSKGKSRFYSRIRSNGRTKFLGYFDKPELAHDAYLSEKRISHKGNLL